MYPRALPWSSLGQPLESCLGWSWGPGPVQATQLACPSHGKTSKRPLKYSTCRNNTGGWILIFGISVVLLWEGEKTRRHNVIHAYFRPTSGFGPRSRPALFLRPKRHCLAPRPPSSHGIISNRKCTSRIRKRQEGSQGFADHTTVLKLQL